MTILHRTQGVNSYETDMRRELIHPRVRCACLGRAFGRHRIARAEETRFGSR